MININEKPTEVDSENQTYSNNIRRWYTKIKRKIISGFLRIFVPNSLYIVSGPPFVAPTIHVGTAYNQLLKNFYQIVEQIHFNSSLKIYRGWDMHGLPIDNKLKELLNYSYEETLLNGPYYKKCAIDYIEGCSEKMLKEFELLKLYEPFDNTNVYSTESKEHYELVWSVYHQLKNHKLIYQKLKIMPFCVTCSATLANIEVEKRKASLFEWYYRFKLNELKNTYLMFWTTTPWTVVGTTAIAYNPTESYGKWLDVTTQEYYIMSSKLPVYLNAETYKFISIIDNSIFHNLTYTFDNSTYKLYSADWIVKPSSTDEPTYSTGLVNIAPLHGENDLQFANANSLKIKEIVSNKGIYIYGILQGESLKNLDVIRNTLKDNLVLEVKVNKEKNVCYRCKEVLIDHARNEYFLKVTPLVKRAIIEYAHLVNWNEESYKLQFIKWVSNAKDWCISRDRVFGIPIPQFGTKTISCFKDLNVRDIEELNSALPQLNHCKKVFDCWFESGCVTLKYPGFSKYFVEGVDQVKGWLYTSTLLSMYITSRMPFYNVHFHGFLLENKTDKLSKSKLGSEYSFEKHFNRLTKLYCLESVKLYFYSLPDSFSTMYTEDNILVSHKRWIIIENIVKYFSNVPETNKVNSSSTLLYILICKDLIEKLNLINKQCSLDIINLSVKGYTDRLSKFLIEEVSRTYMKIIKMYQDKTPINVKTYYFNEILVRINCLLQPYTVKGAVKIIKYPSMKYMNRIHEFMYILRNVGLYACFLYKTVNIDRIKTGYSKILKRRTRLGIPIKTTILESPFFYINYNYYEKIILCDLGNVLLEGVYEEKDIKIKSACRYIHSTVSKIKKSEKVETLHLYLEKYCEKHSLDETEVRKKIVEDLELYNIHLNFEYVENSENIFDEIYFRIN
jgi:isoleucyl-tRNA synthetase